MTEEQKCEFRNAARRRFQIIRKEHGIKVGDGSSVRCIGKYYNPEGEVYYVYDIIYGYERGYVNGLRHFDLFTDGEEETYRHATYDEMMEIMHGLWTVVSPDTRKYIINEQHSIPASVQEEAFRNGFNNIEYAGRLDGSDYYAVGVIDNNGNPSPTGLPSFIQDKDGMLSVVSGLDGLDLCSQLY